MCETMQHQTLWPNRFRGWYHGNSASRSW